MMTTATIHHALSFNRNGLIEVHVRVDDQLAARRKFRSSCSALDETTKAQPKGFVLGSAPDLDYVPVYAGNCKMLANQMSDDEKWQNLSKTRQGIHVPLPDSPPALVTIPKPMSLMTLSQPTPLDDVALKERLSMNCNNPLEGKNRGIIKEEKLNSPFLQIKVKISS